MVEIRNIEKIESPEASAVNQTPKTKDASEKDRKKLEKPSSTSMEPERKNLDRDEKKKLDPDDQRKVSPDLTERGKEQEELEDPHKKLENAQSDVKRPEKATSGKDREKLEKTNPQSVHLEQKDPAQDEREKLNTKDQKKVSSDLADRGKKQEELNDPYKRLEKSTAPTTQMEQTDPDSDEKKKLNSEDIRNVSPDAAKLEKEGNSENNHESEPRKPLREDNVINYVREPEKTNENGAVSEYNSVQKEKNETNAGKMLGRQESSEDEDDGTDWDRTSLTPEQEKIMREMADNGEIDVPMERKNVLDPEQKSPHLPTEKTGTFTGEPGNSEFIPNDQKAQDKMAEYGKNNVEYKNGYPDFSPFVQHDSPWGPVNGEVEIPHMTDSRENPKWDLGRRPNGTSHDPNYDLGNFSQADNALYNSLKDHYLDLKPEDIEKYRKENGLTWHECSDGKTMQLIPSEIHDACRHSGGVAEMKYRSEWGDVERPET